jgi:DNA repair exonuclease SbcCD ATPase subunit
MPKPKQKSRGQRWSEAVAAVQANVEAAKEALEELKSVRGEYEEWKDNLPENLQSSALGEKLEAVCDLDLDGVESSLDDALSTLEEAESMDLPLGFGRD